MADSDNYSTVKQARFQIYPWQHRDFIVLLVNGGLLLVVLICSGNLVFKMLGLGGASSDKNQLWIAIVLTAIAYIYSILLGYGSVRLFEKSKTITNITQILRFYAVIYFVGFCVIYWIVILKLAERDYELTRYFQYIIILALCFIAVRVFASIPKTQDVWVLSALIFITNLIHISSIVFQYIFQGSTDLNYFLQDIAVLVGIAIVALYTLFGKWKVQ
jgi:hypothetical protein